MTEPRKLSEEEGVIELSDTLVLTPVILFRSQEEIGYVAIDVLRNFYVNMREQFPFILTEEKILRKDVRKELNLENVVGDT
jgi:hypothetical protein